VSRPLLVPTQPPSQRVLRALSMRKQHPGCANDRLPPSRVEAKIGWTYSSTLPSAFKTLIGTNSPAIHFRLNVICNTCVGLV
jgi:hypothetical protein